MKFKTHLIRCESCGHLYDINDAQAVRMIGGFGAIFEEMLSSVQDRVFADCSKCGSESYAGLESVIFGGENNEQDSGVTNN